MDSMTCLCTSSRSCQSWTCADNTAPVANADARATAEMTFFILIFSTQSMFSPFMRRNDPKGAYWGYLPGGRLGGNWEVNTDQRSIQEWVGAKVTARPWPCAENRSYRNQRFECSPAVSC